MNKRDAQRLPALTPEQAEALLELIADEREAAAASIEGTHMGSHERDWLVLDRLTQFFESQAKEGGDHG